jgi:biotin transport system substrate-specific component
MNARDLGYIAMAVALISVSAWLALPIGNIPFTLQTAVVFLTAGLLGWKRALLATLAYILLGMIGVPVFAGFTGGVGKILSPTGGYILGFLPIALTVGLAANLIKKKTDKGRAVYLALSMLAGLVACYVLGAVWFAFVVGNGSVGLWTALTTCVFPYLPLDIVKIFLATFLVIKLSKFVKTER